MKKSIISGLGLMMIFGLLLASCKKEEITPQTPPNPPTSTGGTIGSGMDITTSIGGTILDESNQGVDNALVTIGSQTTHTNSLGHFIINNVSVDSDRAYIKVEKAGYFLGSRAVNPEVNAITTVKIKLMVWEVTDQSV